MLTRWLQSALLPYLTSSANCSIDSAMAAQDNEKKWRIQAVPASASSFESRKALPAAWRGLRDQALSDATGLPGCVFVHAAGFIGGHATREGAIQLARKALQE